MECVQQRHNTDPDASIGIVFVDLDGFKRINDHHGHSAGDAVLVQAARRLGDVVTATESAYRLGGDEFVVLAPKSRRRRP